VPPFTATELLPGVHEVAFTAAIFDGEDAFLSPLVGDEARGDTRLADVFEEGKW